MRDSNTALYNEINKVLGYTSITDETGKNNLETLIEKYIFGLRNLSVIEDEVTTAKDVQANLTKIQDFIRLYDNLNSSIVARRVNLDNSKTHKLEAASKMRHIKAVIVQDTKDTTDIDNDILLLEGDETNNERDNENDD